MATNDHHKNTINSLFFNPLIESYPLSDSPFDCAELSDLDFLKMIKPEELGTLRANALQRAQSPLLLGQSLPRP